MTLTEFLLARIAEDLKSECGGAAEYSECGIFVDAADRHAEARRQIVELAWHHLGDEEFTGGMEYAKEQVLELLALPYADHPDYREEWRP